MKKIMLIAISAVLLFSCKNHSDKGKFTVTGEIKNAPDQKIYLEQLFFSQNDPQVLDTAEMKNGKFTASALGPQEGLYRLRLENGNTGFIFINDKPEINFTTDLNNLNLQSTSFNTYANTLLKNFIIALDAQRNTSSEQDAQLQKLKEQKDAQRKILAAGATNPQQVKDLQTTDSTLNVLSKTIDDKNETDKKFIINYIDSVSDPVMAIFALGYTRSIDPNTLSKPVINLTKRFPNNVIIAETVAQYNQVITQYNAAPHIGGMAPEINFPDTSGKPFALSSLRGKYVLIDFWASWCGPCRGENPNVVKAYNEFKDKNFTVLGVSLDSNKRDWIDAINADKLTWNHVSDLQNWNSAAVNLYNFNSIPYNVLIDPQGKIIAFSLRGDELENKLTEVLK
jgi:peroxiredoxin